MVVFPVGMYATLGMRLGMGAGPPVIHRIGTAAAWPAAAPWSLVSAAMIASLLSGPLQNMTPDIREFYIVVR